MLKPKPTDTITNEDPAVFRIFFEESCSSSESWKIGMEYEVGGVHRKDLSPITFFGDHDIEGMFRSLRQKYQSTCAYVEDNYCFGVSVPYGEFSLEPGGQVEFASHPVSSLAVLESGLEQFVKELQELGRRMDLAFYTAGVDPFHLQSDMPWSHKARYKLMRSYLGTRGKLAHRMMQQTMSVQFNIDFFDEADATAKYEACRALQPTLLFFSSNSQIYEGKALDKPMRGDIWLNTDPDRCGLPPSIEGKGYDGYVAYAMDIPMFQIARDGKAIDIANGLTFRQFLEQGFEGHQAMYKDWPMHLSTLFPEVRFKRNALEMRMFDGNQPNFAMGLAAVVKGIFDKPEVLAQVPAGTWGADWASCEALIALAREGLTEDEIHYLAPLQASVDAKQRPGDASLAALQGGDLKALFDHLALKL